MPEGKRPVRPPAAETAAAAAAEGTSGAVAMAARATKEGSENDETYHAISHSLLTEFSVSMCTKAPERCVCQILFSYVSRALFDSSAYSAVE